mmetsp:Transcript_20684/g.48812  ORF Transcript_20684/g.48812 Transcript_20684/m.48812 type:complete len:162 (-) Transcript_20684:100-585(-)
MKLRPMSASAPAAAVVLLVAALITVPTAARRAEVSSEGVAFPFRLASPPPSWKGSALYATRQKFEQHCYGFVYGAVGDPLQAGEQQLRERLEALCDVDDVEQCRAWAQDLWAAVANRLAWQRQAGPSGAAKVPGSHSYSEWCDKVYSSQLRRRRPAGVHRH